MEKIEVPKEVIKRYQDLLNLCLNSPLTKSSVSTINTFTLEKHMLIVEFKVTFKELKQEKPK